MTTGYFPFCLNGASIQAGILKEPEISKHNDAGVVSFMDTCCHIATEMSYVSIRPLIDADILTFATVKPV